MTCPWYNIHREHLSDGSCSLYPSDENENLVHVHHDAQYSTDPSTGRPMALTLNNLDPCKMYNFSLNRRVCSVSTEIERDEIHIAAFEPRNAIEFWTIVRLSVNKWDQFHDDVGYWPSVCTVTDVVLNLNRLESNEPDAIRSLRPVHFVKDCSSFATAMNTLVSIWFKNYYLYVLNVSDEEKLRDILSGGGTNEAFTSNNTGGVKARRIECDAKDHATGFWERHDPDKYKEIFSRDNDTNWNTLKCRLKHIMDKTSFARLQRENRKRNIDIRGAVGNDMELFHNFYYDHDDEDDDHISNILEKPKSAINSERSRSKRLFHAIVVDTFGNHRDYPHTIMCRDFVVRDKRWCSMWLETLRRFSEYRLCRLKQECTDEEEDARTGIRHIMKDWNSLFPTLSESTKQRKRDLVKMMRKMKKNDSIARSLGEMGLEITRTRNRDEQ